MMSGLRAAVVVSLVLACSTASAEPWLAPGDARLRADIQLLADAGVLRGPVTTWPVSWPDVARDINSRTVDGLDDAEAAALVRLKRLAREASAGGFSGIGIRASASHEPTELRTFDYVPREEGELGLIASWLGDHLALKLQGTVVADADDGKTFRPDGSYLGVNIGNFMLSAGFMERWWGPGWEGSLILSTNARPIPGITLERNYTDPFKTRWLSWIGPWRASIAVGESESGGVAVSRVRFLAARVNFKPRPWLEFGLTRTAQWCGSGRPCGWQVFRDLVMGRDNRDEALGAEDEPGNQMAGYDMRVRWPGRAVPLAFYSQWIGEDEAGGLPSKFLGLFGLETWGSFGRTAWQLHAEYADTACNFSRESPQFSCGYRNTVYPQGYAFRGRIIGHAMDNDSRMYSLGGKVSLPADSSLGFLLRRAELNRDGGEHALTTLPGLLDNVELQYAKQLGSSELLVGVGFDDRNGFGDESSQVRGHVSWQRGF
jgi:hypothetical protein